MSGAEQLSQAIMESGWSPSFYRIGRLLMKGICTDSEVVKPNHDLSAQLAHRKERLSFLIKFINDNGVLTKVIFLTILAGGQRVNEDGNRCHNPVANSSQSMRRSCMLRINSGSDTIFLSRTSVRRFRNEFLLLKSL